MKKSLAFASLSVFALLPSERLSLAEEYAPGVVVNAVTLADNYRGDNEGFSEHGMIVLSVLKREVVGVSNSIVGNIAGHFGDLKSPFRQGSFPVVLAYPINVSQWASEIGEEVDVDVWSTRLSNLIPHPEATVVIYGGGVTPTAARAWWILKYLGVEDVRVFNGNAKEWATVEEAWLKKQQQEMPRRMPVPPRVEVRVQTAAQRRVAGNALREQLKAGREPKLIDARSEREYAAGCVPGAKRLEWSELVDAESGKLLPADKLREKFASIGVDPKEPTISYCRTGGRASVTVLALAALGSEQAANYYGSWTEWQESGAEQGKGMGQ